MPKTPGTLTDRLEILPAETYKLDSRVDHRADIYLSIPLYDQLSIARRIASPWENSSEYLKSFPIIDSELARWPTPISTRL